MTFPVRPELPTASVGSSQAPPAAVDNSAPSAIHPESTYKSGKVVQTNGATSVVRNVSLETEDKLRQPLSYLMAIDQLFVDWMPDAGAVKPATAPVLVLNAHASFRAALFLALSGQLLPVFMALRGAIESALYANAIAFKPELEGVWLKREHDEESRKICRNEFSIKNMYDYLTKVQQDEKFTDEVRDVYDSTIDFGAHPNSRSMLRSTIITKMEGGGHALDFAYVHGPQSFELRQSFVACADIGYIAFLISLMASNGHPKVKALNENAMSIRGAVYAFVKDLGFSHQELDRAE